ncbi:MAG: hypothetical protein ACE145_14475 [Terriglobia bacterium]
MNVRNFFDLSQPIRFREKHKTHKESHVAVALPTPASLATEAGAIEVGMAAPAAIAPSSPAPAAATELTVAWQVAIYLILILSIFASRFLDLYRAGVMGEFTVDGPYLLFTAIASLLAFPIVYDRAELTRDRPMLVQIGLIFAAGMGWEKIVATAMGK